MYKMKKACLNVTMVSIIRETGCKVSDLFTAFDRHLEYIMPGAGANIRQILNSTCKGWLILHNYISIELI